MQTIYQYDLQTGAATGETRTIHAYEGTRAGWTRLAPPEVPAGHYAVWAAGNWRLADQLPTVDLAPLKAAKNDEINAARLAANFSTFEHGGKLIACDQLSRSDIDGTNGYVALNGAMPPGWLGAWKAVDNSYVLLPDVDAWKAFYMSMFAAGNANFAHAQALKTLLAAAATVQEIEAIQWGMEI
ncbi:MAG TPA: DUF4376 domain-containing protein [Acidovorax sp.]|jgi:hypothetical protein|nr:DUF4376 domain-containing protein [Acidovorax sp.]